MKKSTGTTQTERMLADFCERSFLKLWSYSVIVRHGTEIDANREFAPHRDVDNAVLWFLFALPTFMILHAICVKLGAI